MRRRSVSGRRCAQIGVFVGGDYRLSKEALSWYITSNYEINIAGLALLDILLQPEVLLPKPKKSLETADALTSRKRIFLRLVFSR